MEYKFLPTPEEILTLITWFNQHPGHVTIDTETTGLDVRTAKVLAVILGRGNKAFMFDGQHVNMLNLLINNTLVLQNFKYDYRVLYHHGIDLRGRPMRDTMLLHHLWNENEEHGLDAIVQKEYGDAYKQKFWERYKRYEDATPEAQLEYACKDVLYTDLLYRDMLIRLRDDNVPDSLIEHVHKLALALYDTELCGIRVDKVYLGEVGVKLQERINQLLPEMRKSCEWGCEAVELQMWAKEVDKLRTPRGKKWMTLPKPEFNFGSSKQLCTLLYDVLGLPVQINRKTRERTADDAALERLEGQHTLIERMREWRGHDKVYSAFIEGTLEKMVGDRIYASFNVNGTVTGRISHSGPNLGQLPSSGGVRGIYVPDIGHKFLSCDYKQLEVTLAAHYSRDANLLKIVLEGASQHDITAQGLNCDRGIAKRTNFSMQYGCTEHKIAEIHNCSTEKAKGIIDRYWATYSGLHRFVKECHRALAAGQSIANPYGRKRHFPTKFESRWELQKAQRQVFNALIQGTGSDITSEAFYLADAEFKRRGWGKGMFTVHDELVMMVKDEYAQEARTVLAEIMINVGKRIGLTVPLSVDCSEPMNRWED